jgi:NADP-dependent aldehyde dehydrogenase
LGLHVRAAAYGGGVMSATLLGTSWIGFTRSTGTNPCGQGIEAGTAKPLEPTYLAATPEEVDRAVALAAGAFPVYSQLGGSAKATFLRAIATEIEAIADELASRGPLETGLPEMRLRGETARTTGQLRMFADLVEEGSWVDARIEHANPDRKPLPKPDLRSMKRPLGPVAVFCASNFPLAFSVAGGDTASALAAGCPVVVVAHSSHPGLAELVGSAVVRAAQSTGMPEGVFSLLYGGGRSVGQAVVKHPAIQAVGFTGSRSAGVALMETAANRPQPIPVYAEMSSINPVVILPGALARGEEALADGFFASLTMGVGQFCTNPGLVFLPQGHGDAFVGRLSRLVSQGSPGTMLNATICRSYAESTANVAATDGVEKLAEAATPAGPGQGAPALFATTLESFRAQPTLQHEMFGPATLIVRTPTDAIASAILGLEGQLTATIHATAEELAANPEIIAAMQQRAGRLVFNAFPTGVEVCSSMVHGGPFPSTSDGRSTSVGTMAIDRFCRPVSWQDFPDAVLPAELQEANPLGIRRSER